MISENKNCTSFLASIDVYLRLCLQYAYLPGLPNGIFSYQKSQLGNILNGLGMENAGIPKLWPLGIFYLH
jgi:hypothetical protein